MLHKINKNDELKNVDVDALTNFVKNEVAKVLLTLQLN